MSDVDKWRNEIEAFPIEGCGRLDLSTYLPSPITVGRVESDRIRYVYFDDDSECVVLGKFCDYVAFKAADYNDRIADFKRRVLEEVEEVRKTFPSIYPNDDENWAFQACRDIKIRIERMEL